MVIAYRDIMKWGVLANTSTRRLPANFTLSGIAAFVAAGTAYERINQSINQNRLWIQSHVQTSIDPIDSNSPISRMLEIF
jgi:hypothetical protein